MNKKLTLLGIVLLIVMTLTSCVYYSGRGHYHGDYDRHWDRYDRGHYDCGPHDRDDRGWDRRPR